MTLAIKQKIIPHYSVKSYFKRLRFWYLNLLRHTVVKIAKRLCFYSFRQLNLIHLGSDFTKRGLIFFDIAVFMFLTQNYRYAGIMFFKFTKTQFEIAHVVSFISLIIVKYTHAHVVRCLVGFRRLGQGLEARVDCHGCSHFRTV